MANSFQNKKALRFVITLGIGKFGSSSYNQITLEGLRATVNVNMAGGPSMANMTANIFGLSQSDMNAITTLQWKQDYVNPNTIVVSAIDGAQETTVFSGNIANAWGDYSSMPNVSLYVKSQAAFFNQLIPVQPRSFKGSIDVATVMSQLATAMGYGFENNGVNVQLADTYLAGTALDQMKAVARAANINAFIDTSNILVIIPANQSRGGMIPLVSPQTGLIGYPTFEGVGVIGPGINFQTVFNPAIKFWGKIKLVSSISNANKIWTVTHITHRLESEVIGGQWSSDVRGTDNGIIS